MTDSTICSFKHHAMATEFEVRIAGVDARYAAQAARSAFEVVDHLEDLLSRFRENSEISQIGQLDRDQTLLLSEPVFACLEIAHRMQCATRNAFSVTPTLPLSPAAPPPWGLDASTRSIRCTQAPLPMDLGAIGKGFALDRMAEELAEWDCSAHLLIAGGSSVVAGAPPPNQPGWSTGLGEDNAPRRVWLAQCSLSGSGQAVKGLHILDPRTGLPVGPRSRVWAAASTGAESDALSTACMVLDQAEIENVTAGSANWAVFLQKDGNWLQFGTRTLPIARNLKSEI